MNGSWSHRAAEMNVVDKRVSCQKDSLLTEEEKVGEGRKMELGELQI